MLSATLCTTVRGTFQLSACSVMHSHDKTIMLQGDNCVALMPGHSVCIQSILQLSVCCLQHSQNTNYNLAEYLNVALPSITRSTLFKVHMQRGQITTVALRMYFTQQVLSYPSCVLQPAGVGFNMSRTSNACTTNGQIWRQNLAPKPGFLCMQHCYTEGKDAVS